MAVFIVLSVESLIKDSADKIAQKASRMAQQLDLIQRALDVRFPVYLLVSKFDLLTVSAISSRAWMIRSCNIKCSGGPIPIRSTPLSAGPGGKGICRAWRPVQRRRLCGC